MRAFTSESAITPVFLKDTDDCDVWFSLSDSGRFMIHDREYIYLRKETTPAI